MLIIKNNKFLRNILLNSQTNNIITNGTIYTSQLIFGTIVEITNEKLK